MSVAVGWVASCKGSPTEEPCGWSSAGPYAQVAKDGDRHSRSTGHAVGYEGRPVASDETSR